MYKKLLLKISGDLLSSESSSFDPEKIENLAKTLVSFQQKYDVCLAIVVGAGNIWRFRDNKHLSLNRNTSDMLGMLATNYNAVLLKEAILKYTQSVTCFSAFGNDRLIDFYSPHNARKSFNDKKITVLAGGTGSPFVTTDSASVLRALELDCDVVLKATKVNGIYTSDPMKDKNAIKFQNLTFNEAISRGLNIMDLGAFGLAKENDLPILVFDFTNLKNLEDVYNNPNLGTLVTSNN